MSVSLVRHDEHTRPITLQSKLYEALRVSWEQ